MTDIEWKGRDSNPRPRHYESQSTTSDVAQSANRSNGTPSPLVGEKPNQRLPGHTSGTPPRVPILVWLGVLAALLVVGATAVDLIRHPSPTPINYCPSSDYANRWCVR